MVFLRNGTTEPSPFTGLEAAYRGSQPRTTDLTNVTAVTSAARAG